jgi:hypothetical protein
MSLRSHFTSIDMHLLGWVGGRYGCHGGALVRIMGWQWGDIRAAWCKRLHMSGYVYSRHDTIKSLPVWCSLHIHICAFSKHARLAKTRELRKDQTSQIIQCPGVQASANHVQTSGAGGEWALACGTPTLGLGP